MTRIIQVAKEELSFYGVEYASLQQLLTIIIGTNDTKLTGELAGLGVRTLSSMTEGELMQFEGLGKTGASRIVAAFGISSHLLRSQKQNVKVIKSPEDMYQHFEHLKFEQQEHFACAYLNTKGEIITTKTIFKGSLNSAIVHPREIFRDGVKLSAASVIVCHNHPSGNPEPSNEDYQVTRRIIESGKMIGIELLDHIVIGDGRYYSFREEGRI